VHRALLAVDCAEEPDAVRESCAEALRQTHALEAIVFAAPAPAQQRREPTSSSSSSGSKAARPRVQLYGGETLQEMTAHAPAEANRALGTLVASGATLTEVRDALDLARARLGSVRAQAELWTFNSEAQAETARRWAVPERLADAAAAVDCAQARLDQLCLLPPTSFVALQCYETDAPAADGGAAARLRQDVVRLRAAVSLAEEQTQRAQVCLDRAQRDAGRRAQEAAHVKRVVLRYVCENKL
jgi:hypothetical protein